MSASSPEEVTVGKKFRPKLGSPYTFYAAIEILHVVEYLNANGDKVQNVFVLGEDSAGGKHAFNMSMQTVTNEFIEVRPFFEAGKKYRFKDGQEALIVAVHETADGDRGALGECSPSRGDMAGRKYVAYFEQYDFDNMSEVE